jgi:hypothetical protein
MMYVRFALSLRNVEDLLFERGIVLAARGSGHADCDGVRLKRRLAHQPVANVAPMPGTNPDRRTRMKLEHHMLMR